MAAGGVARALRGGLGTLAAVALGLGVALLLAEGLVRLFFDEPVQPRFVIDSGYGVRANKPGVDTRHYVPGDYDVRITTNSAGMRGQREYALERPPGTRRVLLLGDSFIFGYGVEDNQVLSVQLEDLLNAGGGPRWEVLNLSVSGFGQAEELVTWEEAGRAWQPDVVVWFYFENDIGNNAVAQLYELTGDGGVRRTGKSFLPGTNLQDAMLSVPPVRWLFENSEAWNLVRNRLSSLVQKSLIREQGLADYGDTSEAGIGLTRALLQAVVDATRREGAVPVMMIIPDRKTMQSTFPLDPAALAAAGVPVVDGREYLSPADYYRRDSHWNPEGHRKTAAKLADVIRALP